MRKSTKRCQAVAGGLLPASGLLARSTCRRGAVARLARRLAFTLVEMLVVMAVAILLITLAVPATISLLRGVQIGQAGQLFESQLDLARQTALAKNRSVEVRLCRPRGGRFSAILPVLISTAVNPKDATKLCYQPVGKPAFLPQSVCMDSGSTLSTLASPNGATPGTPDTDNVTNPPLGNLGQNYEYVSFRFKPDGSTNLQSSKLWFLTLHNATDNDALTVPPNNYYTLQIDPYSGHVSLFRP